MSAMRILWTVNIPLPAASETLGLPKSPFGGWLSTTTQRLAREPGVQLGVAMRSPVPELRSVDIDGIRYYALPQAGKGGLDARAEDCNRVLEDFRPDMLHAEGSEMAYTRRMLRAWRGPRLLSLQGVINGIEPHQLGGLRPWRMMSSMRPRQMLAALALVTNKRLRFDPRLPIERETISLASHIMGRTSWDRAQAWALNPAARYFQCHRTLRTPFHSQRWTLDGCERQTLFIGNSAVPLKGVHVLLESLVLLKREFPDVRLVVAGERPGERGSALRKWLDYASCLNDRIGQLGLAAQVEFTGMLDAQDMAERMRRCHVYVMSSLIENSPNTLGEAMMLGMPCAAAYAGGAPSMAVDEQEALFFRAGDPVTMAHQIKRLFDSDALCARLAEAAHVRAMHTHDPERNFQDLMAAYRTILGSENEA